MTAHYLSAQQSNYFLASAISGDVFGINPSDEATYPLTQDEVKGVCSGSLNLIDFHFEGGKIGEDDWNPELRYWGERDWEYHAAV